MLIELVCLVIARVVARTDAVAGNALTTGFGLALASSVGLVLTETLLVYLTIAPLQQGTDDAPWSFVLLIGTGFVAPLLQAAAWLPILFGLHRLARPLPRVPRAR
jgi:hypothetical protein